MTVTVIQFAVGSVLVIFMWMFNLYKKPKVSAGQVIYQFVYTAILDSFIPGCCFSFLISTGVLQLAAIVPLAMVHTLGNLFTNMSLGKVAVSFTHTIKAMEPFFSVILSAAFLGEVYFTSFSYVYYYIHSIC